MVVSRGTCDLPLHTVPTNTMWDHLSGIKLADPGFGNLGKIYLLLGIETFVEVFVLHSKGQFHEFESVMNEYFESGHDKEVPLSDLNKPPHEVFYFPSIVFAWSLAPPSR